MMDSVREFDIIIWGASGFTGKLVVEYMFKEYRVGAELKWAMGGRNEEKLKKVRAEVASEKVPIVIADSHNEYLLNLMAKRTKVICTTVGPYAKYGSELVAACVKNQTHYCDLTGEVQWMRKMIDQHHETAQQNEVKIVHTCGFDSIPSDMGVYFLQKSLLEQTGQYARKISMYLAGASGGVSGGTYESLSNVMEEATQSPKLYKVLNDPYGLNPEGERNGPDKRDLQSVIYDNKVQTWLSPFIMATINTKVVRRAHALSNYPYGKNFQYEEAMMTGKGITGRLKAYAIALPLGLMMKAKPNSLLKKGIDALLPKAGEGPSQEKIASGYYNLKFFAGLSNGHSAVGKVTGDRDPGYGSTSKMLAESAVCLAQDDLPTMNGVLTPSTAMGDALLERLQKNAGLTFSLKLTL
ncbi:MAG: saccharopine dehydrogenase NADP-binding domain-containing protein [Bacteroidota bacterium]